VTRSASGCTRSTKSTKLRTLKRLLDLGHRPGKIVGLPIEELQRLAQASANASLRSLQPVQERDDLDGCSSCSPPIDSTNCVASCRKCCCARGWRASSPTCWRR